MANEKKIINLKEACELIGISIGYGYQVYCTWPNYGVRILKMRPNARPRFYTADILKMMESKK